MESLGPELLLANEYSSRVRIYKDSIGCSKFLNTEEMLLDLDQYQFK
jgi:hypothetical protein